MVGTPGYNGVNAFEVTQSNSEDDWEGPCSCCDINMTKYCKCGVEVQQRESNDNYRRRYLRCGNTVMETQLLHYYFDIRL